MEEKTAERRIEVLEARIAELELRERDRGRLLAELSHALRSPLVTLLGYLEMAAEDDGELGLDDLLPRLTRSARRLARLVEDVVNLGRLETSDVELRLETVPLDELLTAVVAAHEDAADQRGVELGLRLEGDLPAARVDRRLARIALEAICDNAVRFSDEGGAVEVTAWGEESEVVIQVEDDGIGIPADEIERVFQPLYQVRQSRPGEPGIGAGLTVAKRIVEAHGGRVVLESAPGEGTRAILSFPAAASRTDDES